MGALFSGPPKPPAPKPVKTQASDPNAGAIDTKRKRAAAGTVLTEDVNTAAPTLLGG